MGDPPVEKGDIHYTLGLLNKFWALALALLYALSFYNHYKFPGMREEPLPGEDILWKMQQVLYFGLLGLGLLTDVVALRLDKSKAFQFLFISLVMGALSNIITAGQYKLYAAFFGE